MRKAALVFIFFALLCVVQPGLAAERKKPTLQDTKEWLELARLWRQLSEHWTRRISSQEAFTSLDSEITVALPSLVKLQANDYFDEPTRTRLEQLFQQRVRLIREQNYQISTNVSLMNLEIYTFQARSAWKDLLAWLLWPMPAETAEAEKTRDKLHASLAVELELLNRVDALNALIASHRAKAQEAQAKGDKIDWNQFNLEASHRTRALIDDYLNAKLKPSKETLVLQRLVISLTEEPLQ